MQRFVCNATSGEFRLGEIVELDPRLFVDEIESKVLSPIDDYGNRLTDSGEILVLSSTTEEQRRSAQGWRFGDGAPVPDADLEAAYAAEFSETPGDPDADLAQG